MVVFLLCAPNTDKQAATVGHPTLSLLDRIDDGRSTEDQAGKKSCQAEVTPSQSHAKAFSLSLPLSAIPIPSLQIRFKWQVPMRDPT